MNTTLDFPTYSKAAQAYDLLNRSNIDSQIVRTSAGKNGSCGYSVRICSDDYKKYQQLISRRGFQFR